MAIICWSYRTRILADMARKHYASKEVFCGIKFQTNIKIVILSRSRIKHWNPTTCSFKIYKYARFSFFIRYRHKILLMVLAEFEWVIWLQYHIKLLENLWFSDGVWGRSGVWLACVSSFDIKDQMWERFLKP